MHPAVLVVVPAKREKEFLDSYEYLQAEYVEKRNEKQAAQRALVEKEEQLVQGQMRLQPQTALTATEGDFEEKEDVKASNSSSTPDEGVDSSPLDNKQPPSSPSSSSAPANEYKGKPLPHTWDVVPKSALRIEPRASASDATPFGPATYENLAHNDYKKEFVMYRIIVMKKVCLQTT
jgi:hypothetical protein